MQLMQQQGVESDRASLSSVAGAGDTERKKEKKRKEEYYIKPISASEQVVSATTI
ncbi:MAG: hypothetical protein GY792_14775 [Gammaproteobacteria bacterium]|nr:hypothetical protein [Gammaproteobacteria bacterium]